jgi:hypothetical protein
MILLHGEFCAIEINQKTHDNPICEIKVVLLPERHGLHRFGL